MDTRTKIVGAGRLAELAQAGAFVVSGYFDPLIAGLAEQLTSLKPPDKPLVVLILSSSDPILPARARAELVAALAAVDYVYDEECPIEPAVRLEQDHARALRKLIAHVHARQDADSRPGKASRSEAK